ncbi:Mov34/MPN/PAD-1 family protein [Phocoenobacter skyensis]|nr:Mov34/MPN/PAD-1 family protein [Pasteurella skyensis]
MTYYEWRTANSAFTVRIDKYVLDELAVYRQSLTGNEPESLGILIGKVWRSAFWVKFITKPNKLDKCSRFHCERSIESATINYQTLQYLNTQSKNQLHYLGEWHTHPQTSPTPSIQDYSGWGLLPENNYFNHNVRLFMICSTEDYHSDWLAVQINGVFFDLILQNEQD